MAAGELILAPIREEVQRSVVQPCTTGLRIVAAELGQDAGIIGAALLARDTFAERAGRAGG
jgi:predicted NBD/HSP70 family sugar kinase